jgi:hypothetical protein
MWTYEYDNDGNGGYSQWYNIQEDGWTRARVLGDNEELAKVFCQMMNLVDSFGSVPDSGNRGEIIKWLGLLS